LIIFCHHILPAIIITFFDLFSLSFDDCSSGEATSLQFDWTLLRIWEKFWTDPLHTGGVLLEKENHRVN